MRLTTVFMIAAIMQVSASGFAQRVTFKAKQGTLQELFKAIKAQTGYNVVMSAEKLEAAKPVSANFKNEALEKVLEVSLEGQNLTYTIDQKTIVVREKKPSFLGNLVARFTNIDVRGRVVDETGKPLPNASIQVKGKSQVYNSNDKGEFIIANVADDAILVIRYVGYKQLEIALKDAVTPLEIKLNVATGELEEVKVVYNTGYQNIDKTRATGSFVQVDNELINRKVGTDILSRLEGVVSGLLFDRRPDIDLNNKPGQNLQIRGLYTLTKEMSQPLIVVDNFPFSGNLLDINPNDVDNITILKDAAAASIWGAKAGNGVIVITTKQGKLNQKLQVSLNTNITSIAKPNLFNLQEMATTDYIDVERTLFNMGHYNDKLSDPVFGALTPVQEILLRLQNEEIGQTQADAQINLLRQYDIRNDYMNYMYRNELNQQHAINLNGGGSNVKFAISGGFDKNISNLVGNQYDRITFRSNTTLSPIKQLQLRINLAYSQGRNESNNPGDYGNGSFGLQDSRLYSYARFADENGNPLAIDRSYRKQYTDTAGKGKLLDWKFRPLDELQNSDNSSTSRSLTGGLTLGYSIFKGLGVELSYQYQRIDNETWRLRDINSFYTRDLVNRFTQINGNTVKYVVPKDGILNRTNGEIVTQNLRTALNFNRTWNNKHEVAVLAGGEISGNRSLSANTVTFGYNERLNFSNMDFVNQYPTYTGGQTTIPTNIATPFSGLRDRFVSLYSNASYTYNQKYTLSASARRDASNLFGVKTNDKGRPFWSVGGLWNISQESFYKIDALPQLRMRMTYGFSGNVNQTGRAVTVIRYLPTSATTNLPAADILTPGNPSLRWEKVGTLNVGIDFSLKNQILSGTIDLYNKKSTDVISSEVLDNSTGITTMLSNSANMSGNGIEIGLTGKVINTKNVLYETRLTFAHEKYEVTKFLGNLDQLGNVNNGQLINPYSNPYSIISLRWAGLDPLTGDPRGYLNGAISKDYTALLSPTSNPISNNINHGSAVPKFYGNFLNAINFKGVSLSANITYRLGYFFRRESIDYTSLLRGEGHSDYYKRWQKPGDEITTNIPSIEYAASSRSTFYSNSEILVERGDHIRLEDIRMSYDLPTSVLKKLKFGSLQLYGYFSSLNVLLYKANKAGLDPSFPKGLKPNKSISIGLRATL